MWSDRSAIRRIVPVACRIGEVRSSRGPTQPRPGARGLLTLFSCQGAVPQRVMGRTAGVGCSLGCSSVRYGPVHRSMRTRSEQRRERP
jgi:hypothetical protein